MDLVGVAITRHAVERFAERGPDGPYNRPDVSLLRNLARARPIWWRGARGTKRILASLKHDGPTEFYLANGMVYVLAREDGPRKSVATCYRLQGKKGRDWEYVD